MVLPTPFSSFKVGNITVIFVINHSDRRRYKKMVKKVLLKKIKNKKKRLEELSPLSVVCVLIV